MIQKQNSNDNDNMNTNISTIQNQSNITINDDSSLIDNDQIDINSQIGWKSHKKEIIN